MIEYVDAQKCYMTFCLNAAPISSRVRFFHNKIIYKEFKKKFWSITPVPSIFGYILHLSVAKEDISS